MIYIRNDITNLSIMSLFIKIQIPVVDEPLSYLHHRDPM